MIYKFKSKAAGDLIMLGPNGDQMLRIIGREPAAKGIIEVEQMGAAIDALRDAVRDEDAAAEAAGAPTRKGISLRQRVWPVIDMLMRAQAAREPIVWGT